MDPELKWASKMGAIHHARWMVNAIYILKMIICGEGRFQMGQRQAKSLLDLAFFLLCVYGRYWFAIPVAADAPFLTLSLWKDLQRWAIRDPSLASVLTKKLDRHTWYLSGRQVLLCLWSRWVDDETKAKMVEALLLPENAESELSPGKPDLPRIYPDSSLPDFVTSESWFLFRVRCLFRY